MAPLSPCPPRPRAWDQSAHTGPFLAVRTAVGVTFLTRRWGRGGGVRGTFPPPPRPPCAARAGPGGRPLRHACPAAPLRLGAHGAGGPAGLFGRPWTPCPGGFFSDKSLVLGEIVRVMSSNTSPRPGPRLLVPVSCCLRPGPALPGPALSFPPVPFLLGPCLEDAPVWPSPPVVTRQR